MSLVAAQNSSHMEFESQEGFLLCFWQQNVDTRHHVSHLIKIFFLVFALCIIPMWDVQVKSCATRGQFSRDVFLDVERVVYWVNPKERYLGLWDIKKDLDIKFNARDGRVSTCFLDEYIITKSTSISLPSPGQLADRYQNLAALSTRVAL